MAGNYFRSKSITFQSFRMIVSAIASLTTILIILTQQIKLSECFSLDDWGTKNIICFPHPFNQLIRTYDMSLTDSLCTGEQECSQNCFSYCRNVSLFDDDNVFEDGDHLCCTLIMDTKQCIVQPTYNTLQYQSDTQDVYLNYTKLLRQDNSESRQAVDMDQSVYKWYSDKICVTDQEQSVIVTQWNMADSPYQEMVINGENKTEKFIDQCDPFNGANDEYCKYKCEHYCQKYQWSHDPNFNRANTLNPSFSYCCVYNFVDKTCSIRKINETSNQGFYESDGYVTDLSNTSQLSQLIDHKGNAILWQRNKTCVLGGDSLNIFTKLYTQNTGQQTEPYDALANCQTQCYQEVRSRDGSDNFCCRLGTVRWNSGVTLDAGPPATYTILYDCMLWQYSSQLDTIDWNENRTSNHHHGPFTNSYAQLITIENYCLDSSKKTEILLLNFSQQSNSTEYPFYTLSVDQIFDYCSQEDFESCQVLQSNCLYPLSDLNQDIYISESTNFNVRTSEQQFHQEICFKCLLKGDSGSQISTNFDVQVGCFLNDKIDINRNLNQSDAIRIGNQYHQAFIFEKIKFTQPLCDSAIKYEVDGSSQNGLQLIENTTHITIYSSVPSVGQNRTVNLNAKAQLFTEIKQQLSTFSLQQLFRFKGQDYIHMQKFTQNYKFCEDVCLALAACVAYQYVRETFVQDSSTYDAGECYSFDSFQFTNGYDGYPVDTYFKQEEQASSLLIKNEVFSQPFALNMVQYKCIPAYDQILVSSQSSPQTISNNADKQYFEMEKFTYTNFNSMPAQEIVYRVIRGASDMSEAEGFKNQKLIAQGDKVKIYPDNIGVPRNYSFYVHAEGRCKIKAVAGPFNLIVKNGEEISLELINMPPFFDSYPSNLEFFLLHDLKFFSKLPKILDSHDNFDAIKLTQDSLGLTFLSKSQKNKTSNHIDYDFGLNRVAIDLDQKISANDLNGQIIEVIIEDSLEAKSSYRFTIQFDQEYLRTIQDSAQQIDEPQQIEEVIKDILDDENERQSYDLLENQIPTRASIGSWTKFVSSERLNTKIDDWTREYDVKPLKGDKEPLKLIIGEVTVNGKSRLEFNQPTIVPSFLNVSIQDPSERRLETKTPISNSSQDLIQLSELNAEDIFRIVILRDSNENDDSVEQVIDQNFVNQFYLSITDWTENYIDIFINFTYPLEVSNGQFQDRILIEVINPSLFISKETLSILESKFVSLEKEIPSQLPEGVDGEVIMQNSKNVVVLSTVFFIVNISLQVLFKQNKEMSTQIILWMQNAVIITIYDISIPAHLQIVIDETRKLVNLQFVKPQNILNMLRKSKNFEELQERSLLKLDSKLQASGATSLETQDCLSGYLFMTICLLVFVALMSVISLFLNKFFKTLVQEKIRKLKKKLIWNDAIIPFNMSYFSNCIIFYLLVDQRGSELSKSASVTSYLLSIIIFAQPLICIWILRKYSIKELVYQQSGRFQRALYPGLKYSYTDLYDPEETQIIFGRNLRPASIGRIACVSRLRCLPDLKSLRKYFQIIVYIRRFIIINISLFFKQEVTKQLIYLHVVQLLYMILYIKIDPQWRYETRINMANESLILFIFVSLLCQSDAVRDSLSKFKYGYMTCAFISIQLGFNLVVMAAGMVESFVHQRNIKRRTGRIEQIKDTRDKSIQGKVRSVKYRLEPVLYRAEPNRYLIREPSVSLKKVWLLRFKLRFRGYWRRLRAILVWLKVLNERQRCIYMPLDVVDERQELDLSQQDLAEIDQMWIQHYSTEIRRNRISRDLLSGSKKVKFTLPKQQVRTVDLKVKKSSSKVQQKQKTSKSSLKNKRAQCNPKERAKSKSSSISPIKFKSNKKRIDKVMTVQTQREAAKDPLQPIHTKNLTVKEKRVVKIQTLNTLIEKAREKVFPSQVKKQEQQIQTFKKQLSRTKNSKSPPKKPHRHTKLPPGQIPTEKFPHRSKQEKKQFLQDFNHMRELEKNLEKLKFKNMTKKQQMAVIQEEREKEWKD